MPHEYGGLIVAAVNALPGLLDAAERAETIIAGRTTAPTVAEAEAHEAAGGMWVVTPTRKTISGRSWSCAMSTVYEVRRFIASPGDRWIALDAAGCPCAWPTVKKGK